MGKHKPRVNIDKVILEFDESLNLQEHKIRDEISSCVRTGDYLWLAFDESTNIERLRWNGERYTEHKTFDLFDFLDLPGEEADEMDIEGLAYDNYYLWLTGSMSTKRNDADEEDDFDEQAEDLAEIKYDINRYTLARIPCLISPETGHMELYRSCSSPTDPDQPLRALLLKRKAHQTQLTQALKKDPHLKSFMKIPSKENGFDVEGLAISGDRLFVGLRGPVLSKWAIVLELRVEAKKKKLKLRKFGANKVRYRKHFLNLCGMGIREISRQRHNEDLVLLAGPTMDLDGTISCWRVAGGLPDRDVSFQHAPERLFDVTFGSDTAYGKDKAEGIAILEDGRILIVYDEPLEERKVGDSGLYADIFSWE